MEHSTNDCRTVFERVYQQLCGGPAPPMDVMFYPYADLDHTVRLRAGRLLVRLSDIVAGAPEEVIEALAYLLLGKILRKRIPRRYSTRYREYSHSPEVLAETAHTRALRSRPSPGNPSGHHVDLQLLFQKLNRAYFDGQIQGVRLLWSKRRSMRRLGYYRQAFHTIVLSSVLDDSRVPEYVVEFILYHEMLHARIPSTVQNGRRYDHTPEFKNAERRFHRYQEAKRYLKNWPPAALRRRKRTFRMLPADW